MEDDIQYLDDAVIKILQLIRTEFGDYFHQYYDGEPTDIPVSLLPAVIVRPATQNPTVQNAPTGFDAFNETVMVKIVLNKMNDVGAPLDADLAEKKLRRLVAGRDPVTRSYHHHSILGVLRANITIDGTTIEQDNDIQYKFDIQSDDTMTSEAWITISLHELVPVTRI